MITIPTKKQSNVRGKNSEELFIDCVVGKGFSELMPHENRPESSEGASKSCIDLKKECSGQMVDKSPSPQTALPLAHLKGKKRRKKLCYLRRVNGQRQGLK